MSKSLPLFLMTWKKNPLVQLVLLLLLILLDINNNHDKPNTLVQARSSSSPTFFSDHRSKSSCETSSSFSRGRIRNNYKDACVFLNNNSSSSLSYPYPSSSTSLHHPFLFSVRGGTAAAAASSYSEYDDDEYYDSLESSGEEEEEEYDEEEEEYDESNDNDNNNVANGGKYGSSVLGNAILEIVYAGRRAINAGVDALNQAIIPEFNPENENIEDEIKERHQRPSSTKLAQKLGDIFLAMLRAAFQSDEEQEIDHYLGDEAYEASMSEDYDYDNEQKLSPTKTSTSTTTSIADLGPSLAKMYQVKHSTKSSIILHGGTLTDALKYARAQSCLLLVFVPFASSSSSHKSQKHEKDTLAIQSLLSPEVGSAMRKSPPMPSKERQKYKQQQSSQEGSFLAWCAPAGSAEANDKWIQNRQKIAKKGGGKSPLLLLAYPAQTMDSMGKIKIVPQVLAQHHCNPPPSATLLSTWLKSARKQYARKYATMRHAAQEQQYAKERAEGYTSSLQNDAKRERNERRDRQQKEREEADKRKRAEAYQKRRLILRDSLPQEPSSSNIPSDQVITVALRFGDGRTGRRRFLIQEDVNVLFDWVDGMFEMEREQVKLSSMNGRINLEYTADNNNVDETWWEKNYDEDEGSFLHEAGTTLKDAGLGKMVALRVVELKDNEEVDVEENKE
eukprot:CAMPEP_0184865610 /NCGR_PEP_ID=MMETSP0580-20130426/18632_1 /TAXON_ID=1118495 /ORGANISM="Dactyliosolen fragilissimus" /LENGTH=673 /DNA_ID=CAMNT_0027364885 /DNA_START=10 /DNA_END=2031 /DNA_ORIENTATION=+